MLRACKYCGKVHDSKIMCDKKPIQKAKTKDSKTKFRWTNAWKEKSLSIRQRDNYLCQLCLNEIEMGTGMRKYETENLSVHHIIPLEEDFGLRLEDSNLLTVCSLHHELCESGKIKREVQARLAYDLAYPPSVQE